MRKLSIYNEDVELTELAKEQIGDGQLPNKYFLMLSNMLLDETKKDEDREWASNLFLENGEPIVFVHKVFNTLEEAIEYQEDIILDNYEHEDVHSITIEDRLSGVIYERYVKAKLVLQLEEDTHQEL